MIAWYKTLFVVWNGQDGKAVSFIHFIINNVAEVGGDSDFIVCQSILNFYHCSCFFALVTFSVKLLL